MTVHQRIEISIGWAWIALTALQLWCETRKARSEESPNRVTMSDASAG
jgi:hypothetical protein